MPGPAFSTPAWWNQLTEVQRTQALLAAAVAVALCFANWLQVLVLAALCLYLSSRRPSYASFEPFFRAWFTQDYFPQVAGKVQRELEARAQRERNPLDSLASQFKGWVMGKTASLQASVWYEFWVKYCLPPRTFDYLVARTAEVNLGSPEKPCMVTFWGFHERWFLAPYIHVDFENVSLLERGSAGR